MSIENARKYLQVCLDKHTYHPDNVVKDDIVDVLMKYFDTLTDYNKKYVWQAWFAIRILFTNYFNEVTNVDITNDILCNTVEYNCAYNLFGKDECCLLKDNITHSYIATGIYLSMFNVTKTIRDEIIRRCGSIECPVEIPLSLRFNSAQPRYVPNPNTEIARVLKYLRASIHNEDRYKLYNRYDKHFNLIDWVSREVYCTYSDREVYMVWFATRLLIQKNFKYVLIEDVERLRNENPKVFDDCLRVEEHKTENVYNRIISIADEICKNCYSYGGVFKYDDSIYLPYSLENKSSEGNSLCVLIMLIYFLVCFVTILIGCILTM